MNNRTRNIVIASVISAAALISGFQYKQHQDNVALSEGCQAARQVRRETARLMGRAVMSGHGGFASEATALMQDASDIIANCNAKGF